MLILRIKKSEEKFPSTLILSSLKLFVYGKFLNVLTAAIYNAPSQYEFQNKKNLRLILL